MVYHNCPEYPYPQFHAFPWPSQAPPALRRLQELANPSAQYSGPNHQQQCVAQFPSFYDSHGQMLPRHMRSKSAGVPQHNGHSPDVNWRPPCIPAGTGLENATNNGSKSREERLRENLEQLRRSNEAAYYIRPPADAIESSSSHEDEHTTTEAGASPVDSPQLIFPNPEDAYPAYRKGSRSAPQSLADLDDTPRQCKSCLGRPNWVCEHTLILAQELEALEISAEAKKGSAAASPVPASQPTQNPNPTLPETPTQPTETAQTSQSTPTAPVSTTTTRATRAPVQRTWSQVLFAQPGRPASLPSAKPKSESSAIDETDWPSLGYSASHLKNARKRNPSS
ncbi:hypothetical protein F5B22DRAFT_644305 [Xylaria bambusicola]|uniref:uncharacterized protein n=1 Tax=Xylaria bambusicola TaxID=326684 RepID=UPI002008A377|nr:uncharacterized protein F5B22DRAFT_644305 [Xylaria bambusicola]KAI0521064.1 hypothetical protein F5B22DRAFT_644305 [Xylaria bambusicola]